MENFYPPVPLSWAKTVVSLKPHEIAYGIQLGSLLPAFKDEEAHSDLLSPLEEEILGDARDVLFRLLLINLYKHWFLIDRPLRALEFLVLDFKDCATAGIGKGRLLSGIAGIAEGTQTTELDPQYFGQKIRTFQFLTEFVVVRESVRKKSA